MALTSQGLGAALYRFRTSLRYRSAAYLSLVVLIGLIGGVSLGALAAARRTQSSFAAYLASTNPSNLGVTVFGGANSGGGAPALWSPAVTQGLARLTGVKHVETAIPVAAAPLSPDGTPRLDGINDVQPVASVDGLFFHEDRLAVTAGRLANPNSPDEVVMTSLAAQVLGVHVGEVIPYGIYSLDEQALPGFGTARVQPRLRFAPRLVGLVQQSNGIVEDDIDRFPTFVFFTPALGREVVADGAQEGSITFGLQLEHGNRDVAAVEREFAAAAPPGNSYGFHAIAPVEAKVDRTVRPIAIALGVFGGVAALAALLISMQIIARQMHDAKEDQRVLRALGAGPITVVADGLVGVMASVLAGSLVAVGVATALSPLAPLGPVRHVYPHRGIAFDWTVIGLGLVVLIVGVGTVVGLLAYRGAVRRVDARWGNDVPRPSKVVQVAGSAGLPPPAVIGVHFALQSGRGRTAVPVRSAMLGAILAVALVVATVTFGSGLRSLVSHPSLYGWNFSYMLNATNTMPPQTLSTLDHDPNVAAWDGYDYTVAEVDGQGVPFLFRFEYDHGAKAPISPPVLSGHAVEAEGQIVLGAATLAQLHTRLGGSVSVSYGTSGNPLYLPPTRLTVVGTATMPAVGFSSVIDDHTSMGTGAVMSQGGLPGSFQQALSSSDPLLNGPNLVFVRLRDGVSAVAGKADLQRVADAADAVLRAAPNGEAQGDTVSVVDVQRPAEIVNYRTMNATPALLAAALAVGAVVSLGLTLLASVRRRRRDLAVLKTVGLTPRQLVAALSWQASVAAAIGILVGLPLGIAAGRWLWELFARQINAVPQPSVPGLAVALVAVGTVALANLAATVPGLIAARTPTAHLLRSE
ncbi:MAG TPA: FtsX-like permease family protein [Acidimicrobiales bacterium]|nr:FtsX-like permease family protein [Acidimicrobiales bacterium]